MRNPVLARLDALVGDWRGEAILDGKVVGRSNVHNEWLDDGFLLMRTELGETTPDIPPEWIAHAPFPVSMVIGLDDSGEQFTVLYSDARDVHRVYQMTFGDNVWDDDATGRGVQPAVYGHDRRRRQPDRRLLGFLRRGNGLAAGFRSRLYESLSLLFEYERPGSAVLVA